MPMMTTTTNGDTFTNSEQCDMARLIFKRFGRDPEEAAAAWRRLLQNNATVEGFMALVESPDHTHHCEGDCQHRMNDDH